MRLPRGDSRTVAAAAVTPAAVSAMPNATSRKAEEWYHRKIGRAYLR